MENLINTLQPYFERSFNKISKVKCGQENFHVMLRKKHIPKLKNVRLNQDKLILQFSGDPHSLESITEAKEKHAVRVIKSQEGKIMGFVISDPDRFKEWPYRKRINQDLSMELTKGINFLESDRDKVVYNLIQNRIAHAVSHIISEAPALFPKQNKTIA